MVQTKAHPHSTTILGEPGSPPRGMYYNGKEGRKGDRTRAARVTSECPTTGLTAPLCWPNRSYLLAESFTFCGPLSFVHEIRDVSAKNCGRNGSWPKRPVTVTLTA